MTMANRDMGLLVLTSPTLLAMQARLDAARCEIDFEVYAVPSEVAISLELHLQALAVFFVEMCQESIPLDWLKTTATRLPQERVLQLIDHREPGATQDCLFHAFCDPHTVQRSAGPNRVCFFTNGATGWACALKTVSRSWIG